MNTDLFFTSNGITPLSQSGIDYVRALQARAYLEAWNKGLTMEFDSKSTLDTVTDPGSVDTPWKPVDYPVDVPGYQDDSTCDEDDSGFCGDNEDIESKRSGM